MATNAYFPTYYAGHAGEQSLHQDLVDEQIKMFGSDIYYLPRTILKDNTLDDIIYSKYTDEFQVEMLLQNVAGFGGDEQYISQFGLRITDEVIFHVSTRRWTEAVAANTPVLTDPSRPNEGDLLYFPLTKDLYEIKYVQLETPFYQFGKIQYYTMTAELYVSTTGDDISTGVAEIDVVETTFSTAIALTLGVGGTGDFTVGEKITGATSGSIAEVKSWDSASRIIQIINRTGTFATGESITGDTSSAVWVVSTFDTLEDTNSEYDQNRVIEDTADNIIDWTEGNPFGEAGNFTGSI